MNSSLCNTKKYLVKCHLGDVDHTSYGNCEKTEENSRWKVYQALQEQMDFEKTFKIPILFCDTNWKQMKVHDIVLAGVNIQIIEEESMTAAMRWNRSWSPGKGDKHTGLESESYSMHSIDICWACIKCQKVSLVLEI